MPQSEVLAKIRAEYEEKRNRAEKERKARIDEIYKKFPKFEETEKEFSRLGMANLKRISAEPNKAREYNAELKAQFENLTLLKTEMMKDYGIPANYKDTRYECKMCSDTGYTPDGKRCACFSQRIIDEIFGSREHSYSIKNKSFEKFDLGYYPDVLRDKNPKETAKKALGRAKRLCTDFDNETKGIIFIGEPGLGKTYLSDCIEKEVRKKGKTVLSVRAVTLFKLMEDFKFGREDDDEKLRYVYDAELLIIDDLGTENDSQLNSSFFDEIINTRIASRKKTVISTNYTIPELRNRYSTRFISRLAEYFIISVMYGEDIRVQTL